MMHHFFVIVYDVLTGEIVQELNGHKSCVRDVSWHPYRPEITSSSVSIFEVINGFYLENLNALY